MCACFLLRLSRKTDISSHCLFSKTVFVFTDVAIYFNIPFLYWLPKMSLRKKGGKKGSGFQNLFPKGLKM